MTSIYEVLESDHKLIKQWLTELETEIAAADVEGIEPTETRTFDILSRFVTAHSKAEDKVLYQRLLDSETTVEVGYEGEIEHDIVANLLLKMKKCDRGAQWNAYFKVLKETLEQHIDEEESTVFSRAEEIFPDEETQIMGAEMEASRGELPDIETRVRGASLLHGSKLHS